MCIHAHVLLCHAIQCNASNVRSDHKEVEDSMKHQFQSYS